MALPILDDTNVTKFEIQIRGNQGSGGANHHRNGANCKKPRESRESGPVGTAYPSPSPSCPYTIRQQIHPDILMAKFNKSSSSNTLPTVFRLEEIKDPRCKICNSTFRREIDACLASGWSQAMTIQHFNAIMGEDYFNSSNISTHKKNHLSIKDAAIRHIYEERARQIGMDIEETKGLITTTEGAAASVVQIGVGNMMRGTSHVEVRDLLEAVKILEKMKEEWGDAALPELEREMRSFMKAVKKVVSEDLWTEIVKEFNALLDQDPMQHPAALEAAYVEEKEEDASS